MRLKSGFWVAAYLRRCEVKGAFGVVRQRGAEDAGAIFIRIDRRDGTSDLYAPAPQSAFGEGRPSDRAFSLALDLADEETVDQYLQKQMRFDPDLWIVDIEDRAGRHFLDDVVR